MTDYSTLTVKELKEEIAKRRLSATGVKAELVAALKADDALKAEEAEKNSKSETTKTEASQVDVPTTPEPPAVEGPEKDLNIPEPAQTEEVAGGSEKQPEGTEEAPVAKTLSQKEEVARAVSAGNLVALLTNGKAVIYGPDSKYERRRAKQAHGNKLKKFANVD